MTEEIKQISTIPEDLLRDLNLRFPERCPDLGHSESEIWYMSGQRSVIRLLNQVFAEQREIQLRSE
tara:strand:+ start:316 stop:513 length:198 start_codon:yes stop_codon:yes gene_type:complete